MASRLYQLRECHHAQTIDDDAYTAAKDADAVVILTEWNEFRALDLKRLAAAMATPNMADLRNIYTPGEAAKSGFTGYVSVGRKSLGTG